MRLKIVVKRGSSMAFGINRTELAQWKQAVKREEIAFLTHYWHDKRFPNCFTVTKVGCADLNKLVNWGQQYKLPPQWIDRHDKYPHFDLFGNKQMEILLKEGKNSHITRFKLEKGAY